MILVPPQRLRDIPDVLQSVMIPNGTDPINAEWFDLSKVPIGEEVRLDTPSWRNFPLVRVAGRHLVEHIRPEPTDG